MVRAGSDGHGVIDRYRTGVISGALDLKFDVVVQDNQLGISRVWVWK